MRYAMIIQADGTKQRVRQVEKLLFHHLLFALLARQSVRRLPLTTIFRDDPLPRSSGQSQLLHSSASQENGHSESSGTGSRSWLGNGEWVYDATMKLPGCHIITVVTGMCMLALLRKWSTGWSCIRPGICTTAAYTRSNRSREGDLTKANHANAL